MKIRYNENKNKKTFGELNQGDVFMWADTPCMKIEEVEDKFAETTENMVYLRDGYLDYISDNTIVVTLECELVVS